MKPQEIHHHKNHPFHSPNAGLQSRSSRRRFLGHVGAVLAGGAVLGKLPNAASQSLDPKIGDGVALPDGPDSKRAREAYQLRVDAASREAVVRIPPHTTNGDE